MDGEGKVTHMPGFAAEVREMLEEIEDHLAKGIGEGEGRRPIGVAYVVLFEDGAVDHDTRFDPERFRVKDYNAILGALESMKFMLAQESMAYNYGGYDPDGLAHQDYPDAEEEPWDDG